MAVSKARSCKTVQRAFHRFVVLDRQAMSTTEEHLDQVRRNEELAHRLLSGPSPVPEWAVTLLFYAAVHLAEAYFSHAGVPHPDPPHRQTQLNRRRLMRARPELVELRDLYNQLQSDRENARYDCRQFSVTEALCMQEAYYQGFATPLRALLATRP